MAPRGFPIFGEPPVTPSSSVTVAPTGFPWGSFEKRQFELPSSFSSIPIPTGFPFEKRQFFPPPPPPFPVTPSGAVPTPSGTPTGTPSITPF
ncbi:hypothetical protein BDV59DRAFT_175211 [Aspergillus ambiguus]|uniref:uncharacterized protein n=1 Tax=Aspergillus ambiguus TaxID=176160 RepID=UPI003CCD48CE